MKILNPFQFISPFLKQNNRQELRLVLLLLFHEGITLSLIALAAILSLESILPGTISLRYGSIFFIIGIGVALSLERSLAASLPTEAFEQKKSRSPFAPRLFFFGFLLWAMFLFGNALIGFHPFIIPGLVLCAGILAFTLFDEVFSEKQKK